MDEQLINQFKHCYMVIKENDVDLYVPMWGEKS